MLRTRLLPAALAATILIGCGDATSSDGPGATGEPGAATASATSTPDEAAGSGATAPAPTTARTGPSLPQRPESCATCHTAEVEAWRGSDHDRAIEPASSASVEGDFDAAPFTWTRDGVEHSAAFRRDGEAFFVTLEDAGGAPREHRVLATFGVRPLQQYLVRTTPDDDLGALVAAFHAEASPDSPLPALQCLPVAWDTERGTWFHLEPDAEPGTPFHWTGTYQRWNLMCAECHSTGLTKGYDAEARSYATTWVEPDVGCRACHGDASAHLDLVAGLEPGETPPGYPDHGGFGFDAGAEGGLQVDTCATCHARRSEVRPGFEPGGRFLDHYDPALLRQGLYHADGAIQDEVYVWGSFAQSRMHAAGVACTDCHDPHSARLVVGLPAGEDDATRRRGHYSFGQLDAVCAACHGEAVATARAERFPTLRAADYATPAHHRHGTDLDTERPELLAEAAACVTCHMPEETYMVVDPRRDHAMRVPRAGLGETGPDLCARCHGDQGLAWAADELTHWVERAEGTPGAANRAGTSGAAAIAAARAGRPDALDGLVDLATDPGRSALLRATALELAAGWGPAARGPILVNLTGNGPDEDGLHTDLLRATALRAARGADLPPDPALVGAMEALLDDPRPAVRLALARWANRTRWVDWARPEHAEAVAALATELEASLAHQADMPSTWLDRGILAEERGDGAGAEAAYREALALDPGLYPASMNLATLLSRGGDRAGLGAARIVLETALDQDPPEGAVEGELAYSLGLLCAEQGDLEGAVAPMQRASALLPDQPRIDRNLVLVLWNLGREDEARGVAQRLLGRLDALPPERRTREHAALEAELRALIAG